MNVKTKMFFSKVIVLQLLIQNLKSDCGRPGFSDIARTGGAQYREIFSEDSEITYHCAFGSMLFYGFYGKVRTCKNGKWTGRRPKCGNL